MMILVRFWQTYTLFLKMVKLELKIAVTAKSVDGSSIDTANDIASKFFKLRKSR